MKIVTKEFKISEVGKRDFPELEGKTIVYERAPGDTSIGIIVGCNLDVGITVVDIDDKENYLICMTGAVVPGGGNMWALSTEVIDYTIRALQLGHFDVAILLSLEPSISGAPTGSNCAYGQ